MKYMSLILVIVIILGLYITNPTKEEFIFYVEDSIKGEISTGDNVFMNLFAGVAASITGRAASYVSTRKNYYLFSVYTIKLFDEETKYIGILDKFLPIPEISISLLPN